MGTCKMGYALNEDGTIPQRCHVDWDDGFYPTVCKECPFYIGKDISCKEYDELMNRIADEFDKFGRC